MHEIVLPSHVCVSVFQPVLGDVTRLRHAQTRTESDARDQSQIQMVRTGGSRAGGGVLLVVRASSRRNWRWRDSPGYEKPDRPTAPTFSESSSAPPRSGRTPVSGARISYHVRSIRSKARAILARLRRKTQRMPITEPKMENTSGSKSASTSPCASCVRCQAEVLPHNVDTTLARKEEDCTELRAAMLAIHARSVRLAWDGFK